VFKQFSNRRQKKTLVLKREKKKSDFHLPRTHTLYGLHDVIYSIYLICVYTVQIIAKRYLDPFS